MSALLGLRAFLFAPLPCENYSTRAPASGEIELPGVLTWAPSRVGVAGGGVARWNRRMSGGRGSRVLYVIVCAGAPASGVGELIGAAMGEGWDVCVIATPAAVAFLDVAAIEAQTGWPVFSEYRRPGEAKRQPPADAVVVAPATYNTINKWAAGIVDNYALGSLAEATGLGLPVAVLTSVSDALAANRVFGRSLNELRDAGVRIRRGAEGEAFPWALALEALRG
ncbi:flavoprotein [Streptacidiphilus sp. EB103A]|uniref:flavoprotein n=1 Tax=Streptacidiphilus sp. EB103A TaxID=3156275 RepID=UPI003510E37F